MRDTVEIRLQEGSPFSVTPAPGEGGGLVVTLPKSAVERALLLAGTSYPVLVEHLQQSLWVRHAWFGQVDETLHLVEAWHGSSGLMGRKDHEPALCGVVLEHAVLEGFSTDDAPVPVERRCVACVAKWMGGEIPEAEILEQVGT